MTQNTKFDYAYISGYIDGDGCFYIGKEQYGKRLKPKAIVSIVISSVNKPVLDEFKRLFGGSTGLVQTAHGNSKALYHYVTRKKDSVNLAENMLPYLVEKKEECELLLKFANCFNVYQHEIFMDKMKILKDVTNLVSRYHKEEFEKYKNTIQPSDIDFAYLAGFIDAECSLNIQKYKTDGYVNYTYKIVLQCNNTKAPVFKWLIQRFGGQIHFIDRRDHGKGRKNQLTWRLSSKALSNILDKIYPYLKHKKPVCKALTDFAATTFINGGARHTEAFRSQNAKIIKERERIVALVHKLNRKGIKHF